MMRTHHRSFIITYYVFTSLMIGVFIDAFFKASQFKSKNSDEAKVGTTCKSAQNITRCRKKLRSSRSSRR